MALVLGADRRLRLPALQRRARRHDQLRAALAGRATSPPWSRRRTPACGEDHRNLVGRTESFAEVLDADGRVSDSSLAVGHHVLLAPSELRRALRGPIFLDRGPLPGLQDQSRLLAVPVTRQGAAAGRRRRHLDRGARRVAHRPRAAAADRRAGRPAARLARRLWGRRRGAPPGRGDARPGGGDLRGGARRPAAGSRDPRRGGASRGDAERDAGAARRGAGARARLRRRRQPRAAHAAGDPAHRARARPGEGPLARGTAGRARLGRRGDRPPDPALRGPADDRPDRARRAAAAPRLAGPGRDPRRRSSAASPAAPRRRAARSRSRRRRR